MRNDARPSAPPPRMAAGSLFGFQRTFRAPAGDRIVRTTARARNFERIDIGGEGGSLNGIPDSFATCVSVDLANAWRVRVHAFVQTCRGRFAKQGGDPNESGVKRQSRLIFRKPADS